MRSLTLTFTFRWLYLTQGQWARILTCFFFHLFDLLPTSVFIWPISAPRNHRILSASFEIVFWLAAYLKLVNINTSRENEGVEHHILQMTPSDSSSSTKGQLIPSLTCQRRWRPPPQIHMGTDWWWQLVFFFFFFSANKHIFIWRFIVFKHVADITSQTTGVYGEIGCSVTHGNSKHWNANESMQTWVNYGFCAPADTVSKSKA